MKKIVDQNIEFDKKIQYVYHRRIQYYLRIRSYVSDIYDDFKQVCLDLRFNHSNAHSFNIYNMKKKGKR